MNWVKRYLYIIAILLAAYGCSGNETEETRTDEVTKPADNSVSFSNPTIWSEDDTRGKIEEKFVTGDQIGVYAYYLPEDGSVNPIATAPNFMYNQLVEMQSDGSWTYTPTKYWSSNLNDEYMFFGYAPYSADEEHSAFRENRTGFPIIVHSSPLTMIESRDFVMAGRTCDNLSGDSDVELIFEHVFSRLRFAFRNNLISGEDKYSMVLKSITLINVTTKSAFTYEEDPNNTTDPGLLLVEYLSDEIQEVGKITADIESGALIGKEEGAKNGYSDEAYIRYNETDFTDITTDGEYLFIDPYVIGNTKVMLEIVVEIYADDDASDVDSWEFVLSNTAYLDVTDQVKSMGRGDSYVWQISYQPDSGSALMVYALNYWDDVYNKNDM